MREFNNPQTKFLAEVKIVSGGKHINDFIDKYSLGNHRRELVESSNKAKDYIMDNCTRLMFQNIYVAKVVGATKNYAIDGDYHEPDNEGSKLTEIFINISGALMSGFIAGFLPGYIGVHVSGTDLSQGSVWGIAGACGAIGVYVYSQFIAPNLPSLSRRNRKILGTETIINGKMTLHKLQRILGENLDEYVPSKGRYVGRRSVYNLSGEGIYKTISQSKSSLKLQEWASSNPHLPLFRSPPLYRFTSDVIWAVILDIKIEGSAYRLCHIKSFEYAKSERDFKDYDKQLNGKAYFKILKS